MNPIKFIFVRPRNKFYCQYTINDSEEIHTMKYDEIFDFIIGFVPSISASLRDMLDRFRSFIVSVEDETIEELLFDYRTERMKLKKRINSHNINVIVNKINREKAKERQESSRYKSNAITSAISKLPFTKQGYRPKKNT